MRNTLDALVRLFRRSWTPAAGDGRFVKSALDALVDAGILPGDGPEVIPQPPVQEHYKVETFEDERTEIIIEEI